MNQPFDFQEYVKRGIVRKQSPNIPRAEFLKKEADKSFVGLRTRVEKLGIDEYNANSIIKDVHDIILEKIRAKMLIEGYNASGNYAHESEVAYMRTLGCSNYEVTFINELRQARNGINYYGKLFEEHYAKTCVKFLLEINKKLNKLFVK